MTDLNVLFVVIILLTGIFFIMGHFFKGFQESIAQLEKKLQALEHDVFLIPSELDKEGLQRLLGLLRKEFSDAPAGIDIRYAKWVMRGLNENNWRTVMGIRSDFKGLKADPNPSETRQRWWETIVTNYFLNNAPDALKPYFDSQNKDVLGQRFAAVEAAFSKETI